MKVYAVCKMKWTEFLEVNDVMSNAFLIILLFLILHCCLRSFKSHVELFNSHCYVLNAASSYVL